ncbi:MAG TPA: hypothetical protein VGZ91_04760 [Candidatus Sulfotelmatobacter sp.]|jgi:hypothetical protein|nr:hypothetical protein [Candidatus Sulfotelmatobacter sp.]
MRSLDATEEAAVAKALDYLRGTSTTEALNSHKLHVLRLPTPDRFYSFRATPRLRLVLALSQTEWLVEDILDHRRIDRLLRAGERS